MRLVLFSIAVALLLAGCVSQPAPPARVVENEALPSDEYFVADPVYLGSLQPLSVLNRTAVLRVRLVDNAVLFQDYFNPAANASTRDIGNLSQPSLVAFNILNKKAAVIEGRIRVETDFEPRNASTSFPFLNMYVTENVFQKQNQSSEISAYIHSNATATLDYGKVPLDEGFVVFIIFFPTTWAEPSAEGFEKFFEKNKGKRQVRFLHEYANQTRLIAKLEFLFE